MTGLLKRALLAVVGMVATLVWWSVRPGDGKQSSADHIPPEVWSGGGGELRIEAEASCPATLRVSFFDNDKQVGDQRLLQTWEKVPAGSRTWTIQVPPRAGGTVELDADGPQVGDRLRYRLTVNGRVVDEKSESLDEALQSGYAFFLQTEFGDYGKGKLGMD